MPGFEWPQWAAAVAASPAHLGLPLALTPCPHKCPVTMAGGPGQVPAPHTWQDMGVSPPPAGQSQISWPRTPQEFILPPEPPAPGRNRSWSSKQREMWHLPRAWQCPEGTVLAPSTAKGTGSSSLPGQPQAQENDPVPAQESCICRQQRMEQE